MALNFETPIPRGRRPSGKPTILQLCPVAYESAPTYPVDGGSAKALALALCRTDNGHEVFGVDALGLLFVLEVA